jgi:hypothetical protein
MKAKFIVEVDYQRLDKDVDHTIIKDDIRRRIAQILNESIDRDILDGPHCIIKCLEVEVK